MRKPKYTLLEYRGTNENLYCAVRTDNPQYGLCGIYPFDRVIAFLKHKRAKKYILNDLSGEDSIHSIY